MGTVHVLIPFMVEYMYVYAVEIRVILIYTKMFFRAHILDCHHHIMYTLVHLSLARYVLVLYTCMKSHPPIPHTTIPHSLPPSLPQTPLNPALPFRATSSTSPTLSSHIALTKTFKSTTTTPVLIFTPIVCQTRPQAQVKQASEQGSIPHPHLQPEPNSEDHSTMIPHPHVTPAPHQKLL